MPWGIRVSAPVGIVDGEEGMRVRIKDEIILPILGPALRFDSLSSSMLQTVRGTQERKPSLCCSGESSDPAGPQMFDLQSCVWGNGVSV